MLPPRVFLLSPAHLGGERARILLRDEARFDLAMRVKGDGAPIGEIFAFLSGLYFRGKLHYATAFAASPRADVAPAYVITSNRGLITVDTRYRQRDLEEMGTTDIDARNDDYRKPLSRDAKKLARQISEVPGGAEVVLLGSVASTKYIEVLEEIFAERLVFPIDFVGRGDMSRGSLMLRAARAGVELPYVSVCDVLGDKLLACRARSS
jgi:hypothetical protein